MEQKSTLRDVAQLAGLSAGTVSKYLNHPECVQEKNRKKIEKAIRLLNYTPNVLARKLASGRSRVLGLCIVTEPEISDSTWLHLLPMIQTLNDSACQAGYQLQIGLSSVGREEQTFQMLRDGAEGKGMDGLFLVSAWEVPEDLIRYLLNREFPFVLVENHSRCLENRQFYFDNYGIGVSCTKYLSGLGHREIGFFHAGGSQQHMADRYQGYLDTLKRLGLPWKEEFTRYGDYSIESGFCCMEELFSMECRPTAVICGNDNMAAGALQFLRKRGLSAPETVSLIGVDDSIAARAASPALTSVHLPMAQVAKEAAQALIRQIEEGKPAESRKFSCRLVERESTAPGACQAAGNSKR